MEALMSNILFAAARVKRPAEDAALDLTKTKFLRHTCDSLIEHGDLRSGTDSNADGYNNVKKEPNDKDVFYKPYSKVSPCKDFSSPFQASTVRIKEEVAPNPFSIEALLGDVGGNCTNGPTAPAIVFSFNTTKIPCTTFNDNTLSGFNQSDLDGTCWCHVCNALCIDYKNAQGHQYLHFTQGAKCNMKKVLFQQHGYVTKHVKLDDEKIKCGLCDKIVAQCFFTKHQRLHDGHFCDICNHEFSTNSRLQDHMNIHTGNMPFSCKVCNRKFAKRSSLTQHQRYHRDYQSFKCGYCPKSFNSKYARAVHERLHTGENPFKCQVPGCTREFPQKIQLQLHMTSHK